MTYGRRFTLIEITVVVVILDILTALAAPKVIDRIIDSRIQAAKTDISTIDIYSLGADQRPGGEGNDIDIHWKDL